MVEYDYGKADYFYNAKLLENHIAKLEQSVIDNINLKYKEFWDSLPDDPEHPNAQMPSNLWEKAIHIPLDSSFDIDFLILFGVWAISKNIDECKAENKVVVKDKHIKSFLKDGVKENFTDLKKDQIALVEFIAKGFNNAVFW